MQFKYSRLQVSKEIPINDNINPLCKIIQTTIDKPVSATKYATYKSELNPKLNVHEIYSGHVYIPDSIRQAFTRIRLMSHSTKSNDPFGGWRREGLGLALATTAPPHPMLLINAQLNY